MNKIPITRQHTDALANYNLQHLGGDSIQAVHFKPGELLSEEGQALNWFFLVVEGRAKIYRTGTNGEQHILGYYASEGIIGEIELVQMQADAHSTAIAISEVNCIGIRYALGAKELHRNVIFLQKVASSLADKVKDNADNLVALSLNSGEQRLCAYILSSAHNNLFRDVLTDVAASIGISYRHVFRILNKLCAQEVLEKQTNGYHILNHDLLSDLAQPK